MKILMVCLGNICRSPLAEGILKEKIKSLKLNWVVDSAGTGSWHVGELPDSRSIAIAKQNDIDITDQRSRQLITSDLDQYDLILAMDRSNHANILRLCQNETQKEKVKMVMDFLHPNQMVEIPDPYYHLAGFEEVYEMLDNTTDALIKQLKK